MVAARAGQGQQPGLHNFRASLSGRSAEIAAALFAIALYLPSLGFSFVFDDHALIDAGGRPLALGGVLPYRPVRYASYWIDAALGGTPLLYHAHSVLLFALLVALVAALARRLGATAATALLGALLLAAHPLAVEAVAYVAGRRDLLSAVLGVGALLAWIDARRGMALVLLLLGVGSKENALLFAPVMLLAGAFGVARRRDGDWRVLAAGSAAALVLVLAYGAIGPWAPAPELAGLALPGRVLLHYVDHLLRPLLLGGAGLSVEYPDLGVFVERVRGGGVAATAFALACTALTSAVVAGVLAAIAPVLEQRRGVAGRRASPLSAAGGAAQDQTAQRSWRFVAAWAAVCVAALATWGGLHEPGADRHALVVLPVAGVAAALALTRLCRRRRVAAFAIAIAAVLVLAQATLAQMQTWRSDQALWTHAVAAQPHAPRARLNLAGLLAAQGRYQEATQQLGRALHLQPNFIAAYLGRAVVRCAQRRPVAARRDLTRALTLGARFESVAGIGRECPLPEFAPSLPQPASSPARLEDVAGTAPLPAAQPVADANAWRART